MAVTTTPSAATDRFWLLRVTKEYWFLVTLLTSLALSGVYMVVFHVTPWDTYRQIEMRRNRVALHDRIGQRLLESGQYGLAIAEFDRALALDALDDPARAGRYLAELFIALPQPTWDAVVWSAERDALLQLAGTRDQAIDHIVEKYLGDVELRIGNLDQAAGHYERALAAKPDYPDALYAYGWYYYSSKPDIARMEALFRKMTAADQYDYRGFHGLGYALYMCALSATSSDQAIALLREAAQQSQRASNLRTAQLNVMVDFGEVARAVFPQVSQFFHEEAMKLLDDPETSKLSQVTDILDARLLRSPDDRHVYIRTNNDRHAWVRYELALDHLAESRSIDNIEHGRAERAEHDRLFAEARKLDASGDMLNIYQDQLKILDQFNPPRTDSTKF